MGGETLGSHTGSRPPSVREGLKGGERPLGAIQAADPLSDGRTEGGRDPWDPYRQPTPLSTGKTEGEERPLGAIQAADPPQ